jgi:hypothetical protein
MFIVAAVVLFRRSVGAQQRNVPLLRSWANRSTGYKHFASTRRGTATV